MSAGLNAAEIYLEAAKTASARASRLLASMVFFSIVVFVPAFDTVEHSWADVRLERAMHEYDEACGGESNDPRESCEEAAHTLAEASEYAFGMYYVEVPVFGVVIDINDYAPVAGIAALALMAMALIAQRSYRAVLSCVGEEFEGEELHLLQAAIASHDHSALLPHQFNDHFHPVIAWLGPAAVSWLPVLTIAFFHLTNVPYWGGWIEERGIYAHISIASTSIVLAALIVAASMLSLEARRVFDAWGSIGRKRASTFSSAT